MAAKLYNLCRLSLNWDVVARSIETASDEQIEYKDQEGKCILHAAIEAKAPIDIIRRLIDKGVDVNSYDQRGETPLHSAVICTNDIELVTLLISNGADVNAENKQRASPIHAGILQDKRGRHSRGMSLDMARTLSLNGANLQSRDNRGSTILHSGSRCNASAELIKFFIETGTNPSIKNVDGMIPLHFAAQSEMSADAFKMLVEKTVDLNAREPLKWRTPLMFACQMGNGPHIRAILTKTNNKIKFQQSDKNGWTAWHFACDSPGIIAASLRHRGNIYCTSHEKESVTFQELTSFGLAQYYSPACVKGPSPVTLVLLRLYACQSLVMFEDDAVVTLLKGIMRLSFGGAESSAIRSMKKLGQIPPKVLRFLDSVSIVTILVLGSTEKFGSRSVLRSMPIDLLRKLGGFLFAHTPSMVKET